MADRINDGGAAFPVAHCEDANGNVRMWGEPGMTLRDYFAAHASEADVLAQADVIRFQQVEAGGVGVLPDGWRTKARYMHADAMLEARQA